MARGKLRIRQRGSRQQWAQARSYKEHGDSAPVPSDNGVSAEAARLLSGGDVIAATRCGFCNRVVERRLRSGSRVVVSAYALCLSCDEARCQGCFEAEDDGCVEGDEHELGELVAPG